MHYCDHGLSVVRPSLTSHFDFSETAEQNLTKLDRKQVLDVFYLVCVFQANRKNKMAALASDWLRHFQLEWNWMKLNRKQDLNALYQVCALGQKKKQDGRPGLWLAETFSTSPLKLLNGIERNFTGSKISMSSTKLVFFRPIGKKEMAALASDWLRKQDLNVLYQVFVFRVDQKNKIAALTSDWLRHFRLLLRNRWTYLNEAWQEVRS